MHAARVGEVVEASTAAFVAQAYELSGAPPFGAFVWVADGPRRIVGAVCHAKTGALDAGRQLVARGQDGATREEIFHRHPELPHLLRTLFTVRVLGFIEDGEAFHRLPPQPAALHEAVYACAAADVAQFTASFGFLPALLAPPPEASAEEFAAAALRRAAQARGSPRHYLIAAGREIVRLLGGDPARLTTLLLRMRP